MSNSCYDIKAKVQHWKVNDGALQDFYPDVYIEKLSELRDGCNGNKADVIIISCSTLEELTQLCMVIKQIILSPSSLVLVDCTYAVGLDDIVTNCLDGYPSFAFTLSEDVEFGSSLNCGILVCKANPADIGLTLGYSAFNKAKDTTLLQGIIDGKGKAGVGLQQFDKGILASGIKFCNIIPPGRVPSVGSYCWKRIISFVCFSIPQIIFGEIKDLNDLWKVDKELFVESVQIARSTGALEFPERHDYGRIKNLFRSSVSDFNSLQSPRYRVHHPTRNYPMTPDVRNDTAPRVLRDFCNGNPTFITLSLSQMISLAKNAGIEAPTLEFVFLLYKRVDELRKDRIFDWVRNKCFHENNRPSSAYTRGGIYYSGMGHMAMVSGPTVSPSNMVMAARSAGLVSIHPRFHSEEKFGSGRSSNHGSVRQVKESLYRKSSVSSFESYEDIAKSQMNLFEHANVKNMMEDTTSRYGDVDTLPRLKKIQSSRNTSRASLGDDVSGSLYSDGV